MPKAGPSSKDVQSDVLQMECSIPVGSPRLGSGVAPVSSQEPQIPPKRSSRLLAKIPKNPAQAYPQSSASSSEEDDNPESEFTPAQLRAISTMIEDRARRLAKERDGSLSSGPADPPPRGGCLPGQDVPLPSHDLPRPLLGAAGLSLFQDRAPSFNGPSDESSDSCGEGDPLSDGSRSSEDVPFPRKKKSKTEDTPSPSAYWVGRGRKPPGVGQLSGSRQKFSDLQSKAITECARVDERCKGKVPTARYAKSHLLLGFQLREVKRIWHELGETCEALTVCGSGSKQKELLVCEGTLFRHLGASLQVGVDTTRHELAMADIYDELGAVVVDAIEGGTFRDPRYAQRAKYVVQQLKRAKVDEAVLKGRLPIAPLGQVRRLSGRVPYRGIKSRGKAITSGGLGGRPLDPPRCYTCNSPLHMANNCPRKKDVK
ncbi:uncharacterized protein LOC131884839 [Tigriopus californicus]|uniref:uncharacterized protein LOC131884839 n=1 Tax=Tigriopus californicus TaxID=6832 RepID=UPI0027D9D79F|nr:uncharacterized protein LOC131884839 [Tigriopus californicus]